ncbi:MAG TPA: AsmA family protein [Methylococcaceae bacterium]|nr:AsmA family protein [Methylococcaceae bacterium]HIA45232.1 AsmA family protein [Methylococcaceae bacterium]HIB61607.1 AsmA family protein [Methylococcaceae bacterium]HIO45293.1 AsmA family protein [Methylococcales bacterium]
MGKLLKIVSGLVLLIVVAAIVAPMVIDPNDYREQIQTVVKEKTGRDLAINGDLSLSVFPWIGIGINDVSLSNAVGFKAEPFAKIQEANVKVKLLPLLSQQVEVSTVVLKGMSLSLEKNKAGKTNWDDMVQSSTEPDATKDKPTEESSNLAMGTIAIGGLQIVDAKITWDDASKGERYSLADLDLTTDALSLGSPMGVELALTVDSSKPKATVRLKLNGDLVINSTLDKFDFQGITLVIDAAGDPVPGGAMTIDIASHLIADLASGGSLTLNPLTIKFDDSTLSGNAAVNNFAKPTIQFDLAVDAINLDRYLPKPADTESGAQTTSVAPSPVAVALIPVQTIRDLNIEGVFKVQSLIVNGLTAEEVSVKLVAKNGVLKSEQGIKKFYNGSYVGETVVDARQNTPRIIVTEQVTNINIEPLLIDLLGESPIAGIANITAALTTRGNTVPAFKSALNGTAKFSFNDGAVTGVDVGALMKQAQAILHGDFVAAFVKDAGKTPFSEASGTVQINDGLVNNQDLIVTTPLVNVAGVGTANLVNEQIDYQLTLQRPQASDAEELGSKDIKNILIPVNISGTFANPSVSLDVKAMVMNTQRARIDEQKEALKKKINEKLKGVAGELLKGLF